MRGILRTPHLKNHRQLRIAAMVERAETRARSDLRRITPPPVDVERMKPRVERAVLGFGFINPMLSLPQLYNIFVSKHVAGLSAVTIGAALFMSLLWTAYGLMDRQTVVWSTSAIWVLVNGVMLLGVTIFA